MIKLTVRSGSKTANITLDNKFTDLKSYLLTDFFPRESIPSYQAFIGHSRNPSFEISIFPNDNSFMVRGDSLYINPSVLYYPDFIYHLILKFNGAYFLEHKSFIHSAAVQLNNSRTYLIIGDAGSGKTTLSFLLSILGKGEILSNDRTIVDLLNRRVCGGTTDIDLRPSTLEFLSRIVEDEKYLQFKESVLGKIRKDRGILKYEVNNQDLKKLGISIAYEDMSQITDVIFLTTYPSHMGYVYLLENQEGIDRLYYFISQYVRGDGRYWVTFNRLMSPTILDPNTYVTNYSILKNNWNPINFWIGIGDPLIIAKKLISEFADGTLKKSRKDLNYAGLQSISGSSSRDIDEIVRSLYRNGIYVGIFAYDPISEKFIDLHYPYTIKSHKIYSPLFFSQDGKLIGGVVRDDIFNPWTFLNSQWAMDLLSFEPEEIEFFRDKRIRGDFIKYFATDMNLKRRINPPDSLFLLSYNFSLFRLNGVFEGKIYSPIIYDDLITHISYLINKLNQQLNFWEVR